LLLPDPFPIEDLSSVQGGLIGMLQPP